MTAGLAAPAAAGAACVDPPSSPAFSVVGDSADYALAPGGDFERGAPGWALRGGAYIGGGNESLGVTHGQRSLVLPLGASATSPEFCVDQAHPHFRFVSRPTGALAGYAAIVVYRDAGGRVAQAQFTSSGSQSWEPGRWAASAPSPLATRIPLGAGETASVQLKFVSTGNELAYGIGYWGRFALGTIATSQIDSVMVDPYRRG